MNKMKIVLVIVAAVAIVGALSGCSFGWKTSYIYDNADKYVAGDREITEKIEAIELDYMSGDVTLIESDKGKVVITETSNKPIDDARKVHTWVDGTTLYVKYCASAKNLDLNLLGKKLTIEIPAGTDLSALNFKLASGNLNATCSAGDIKVHVSSGNISFKQHGVSEKVDMKASSGDIDLDVEKSNAVDLHVSSGDIVVNADAINEFGASVSSGKGNYSFAQVPATSDIHGSSGDITVNVPENSDLTAKLKTSSGKVNYELAFAKNDDSYVCGNGSNQMKVHTSSGDVNVKVLK